MKVLIVVDMQNDFIDGALGRRRDGSCARRSRRSGRRKIRFLISLRLGASSLGTSFGSI